MFKGYKDYRSYLNAKLHALSIKICGSRELLDTEIDRTILLRSGQGIFPLPAPSTTLLTIEEAENIYRKLFRTLNNLKKKSETDPNKMTPAQRNAIIKLTKYEMNWSVQATFSFILGVIPERRKRLSSWEIANSKMLKLYSIMSKEDANKVIKRLDQIKKRNLSVNA